MNPVSVVIPAYNESGSIRSVVESVRLFMAGEKREHEVIVVDDCSSDTTAAAAQAAGAAVVTHPVNRGYGAALTTGIKKAKHDVILIMDADGTYPIAEAKKLLPFADAFDMVVGARQGKHYHGSPMKRFSRIIFYMLLNYVTAESVPDANSGLRIFKKSVVMQFEDNFCRGFSFTTTLTLLLLANGYLVKFVPVEYHSRGGSKSKVKYARDTARTVQILMHAIISYNPIKAFLPFSLISLVLCLLFAGACCAGADRLLCGLSAVMSFFSAMLFLGLGMIAYAVVRRGIGKR